jgi:hypothetical protein
MRSAPGAGRIVFFVAIALPLFAIWGVVFPPLLDFPEHALIAQAVADPSYSTVPEYRGSLYRHSLWAPYSMFYLLALPLTRLVSAVFSVKLLLSFAVVGSAISLRWFLRVLQRDPFAFCFAFPFLFSLAYLVGLIPYVLGVPLLIVTVTVLLRQPVTTWQNFAPRLVLAMALPWAHPLIYAAAAPVLAAVVLMFHWRSVRQIAISALWIGLPAVYLLLWTPAMSSHHQVSWQYKTLYLHGFISNLGAYDTPSPDRLFLLPKLPLLLWLIWMLFAPRERETWTSKQRALGAGVGVLLLLVAVLPESYSSQLVAASFRFTPIAAVLGAGLLSHRVSRPLVARVLLSTWCVGALAGHAVLAWRFDHQMDGYVTLERHMQPRQTVTEIFESPENMLYRHALSYYVIEKGGLCPQNLLTNPEVRHFPARLLPPFPWGNVDWESNDPLTHPAGRTFRYVLVRTSRKPSDPLPKPPNHRLVGRAGGWVLYERQ